MNRPNWITDAAERIFGYAIAWHEGHRKWSTEDVENIIVHEMSRPASAEKQAEFGKQLIAWMQSGEALENVDDRKLLWLLKHLPVSDQPAFSPNDAIIGAIEDRLYPEYDGETVIMTERGWSTPEGEINYF